MLKRLDSALLRIGFPAPRVPPGAIGPLDRCFQASRLLADAVFSVRLSVAPTCESSQPLAGILSSEVRTFLCYLQR